MPLNSRQQRNYTITPFTGNLTLAAGNAFQLLKSLDAGAQVVTVPPFDDVPFDEGVQISLVQFGAGAASFAEGAGVTIETPVGLSVAAQFGIITIIRTDVVDVWFAAGNLA